MSKPVIHFENFSFKYDSQKKPTLHNINLSINQGEKVLIVGPSGSGKSTLGHCLNGLIPFSYPGTMEGSLTIMGEETKSLDIFKLSKIVGTVLQDSDGQFIGLSVGEDIAFALENDAVPQAEMKQRVTQTAEHVHMGNLLTTSVHHLSGGQRQRVAIGGVLVSETDVLLFDEPLSDLDPKTGKYAISLIDELQKKLNATVIIIEHRLEDVLDYHIDRVIVMDQGRIVSDSTPSELLASNVLEQTNLREPLYIKALKYAGCTLQADKPLDNIFTLDIDTYKDKVTKWDESTPIQHTKLETPTILEVRSISFTYPGRKSTLNNVSFSLKKGEMVSIVGKNGAGKSTLAKLVCGLEKVDQGTFLYHETDITNETIRERAEKIGMVMQNPNHMISKHMIFDEIALGLVMRGYPQEEIEKRVEHALQVCGLYPFRNWPISALSFGQRKRVTIASILVLEPKIIILDEPTSGQDFYHYTLFMEFLTELNRKGMTIILITHDMHVMLEYTSRSLVFADGELISDKSSIETLADERVVDAANLKQTSLYTLAERAGLPNATDFVTRFISYDRGIREKWQ